MESPNQGLNDVRHSYFTVQSDIGIRDFFELRMLEENRIGGLLDLTVCDDDGILVLNYDITGKEPLSELLKTHRLRSDDIRHILLDLKHLLAGLEPYLLSGSGLVLNADSVFADPLSLTPSFLYLPGRTEAFSASLTSFLQYILSATDHDDYNSVVLAYRLCKESENNANAIELIEQILIAPEGAPAPSVPDPCVLHDEVRPGIGPDEITVKPCVIENIPEEKSGFLGRLFRKNEVRINPPEAAALSAEETLWMDMINDRNGQNS